MRAISCRMSFWSALRRFWSLLLLQNTKLRELANLKSAMKATESTSARYSMHFKMACKILYALLRKMAWKILYALHPDEVHRVSCKPSYAKISRSRFDPPAVTVPLEVEKVILRSDCTDNHPEALVTHACVFVCMGNNLILWSWTPNMFYCRLKSLSPSQSVRPLLLFSGLLFGVPEDRRRSEVKIAFIIARKEIM